MLRPKLINAASTSASVSNMPDVSVDWLQQQKREQNHKPGKDRAGQKYVDVGEQRCLALDNLTQVTRYSCVFFLTKTPLMFSNNSSFAPCLRMITLCCITDSVLFHAQ